MKTSSSIVAKAIGRIVAEALMHGDQITLIDAASMDARDVRPEPNEIIALVRNAKDSVRIEAIFFGRNHWDG